MRLRRDARFLLLYVVSSALWALALWFARSRPVAALPASPAPSFVVTNCPPVQAGVEVDRARGRDATDAREPDFLRPRILGKGKTGKNWVYWDVRDYQGIVKRYYARRDPASVVSVLRTMQADLGDSRVASVLDCSADSSVSP